MGGHCRVTATWTLPLLMVLGLTVIGPITAMGSDCEDCHDRSDHHPGGGYTYDPPVFLMVHDPFYPVGSDISVVLESIHPPDYSLRILQGELSISGTSVMIGDGRMGTVSDDGEWEKVTWELTSVEYGSADLLASVVYEVSYDHDRSGGQDTARYEKRVTTSILVADLGLRITPGTVILSGAGRNASIHLLSHAEIDGLRIKVSPSLDGWLDVGDVKGSLAKGEEVDVVLKQLRDGRAAGEVNISWTEEGSEVSAKVTIEIIEQERSGRGGDTLLEIGRYTGLIAFMVLLSSYITGGTTALKRVHGKLFESDRQRIRVHCVISFLLLAIVIIHSVTLVLGPYGNMLLTWEVVLGEIALTIMLLIALNGIFRKRIISWWGNENWRRIHSWGASIAVKLVIIHMLFMGSHFTWFRELIGI